MGMKKYILTTLFFITLFVPMVVFGAEDSTGCGVPEVENTVYTLWRIEPGVSEGCVLSNLNENIISIWQLKSANLFDEIETLGPEGEFGLWDIEEEKFGNLRGWEDVNVFSTDANEIDFEIKEYYEHGSSIRNNNNAVQEDRRGEGFEIYPYDYRYAVDVDGGIFNVDFYIYFAGYGKKNEVVPVVPVVPEDELKATEDICSFTLDGQEYNSNSIQDLSLEGISETEDFSIWCNEVCANEDVENCEFKADQAIEQPEQSAQTPQSQTPPAETEKIDHIKLPNPLTGNYSIQQLLGLIVGRAMGVLGSITLAVFVYGGFMYLTSAGKEEKIKSGTNAMIYAVVGIFIIFTAYVILSTIMGSILGVR
jgi:hypothetical protein